MTMTKDEINELIKSIEETQKHALSTRTKQKWYSVKQALTEYRESLDRFDLLQHLREGGFIWKGTGAVYRLARNTLVLDRIGDPRLRYLDALFESGWQPYEPPVEDMLEDGGVYWVKDTVTGVIQDTPYKWIDKHFIFPDGEGGYFDWPIDLFQPVLRDGKPIKIEMPE